MTPEQKAFVHTFKRSFTPQEKEEYKSKLIEVLKDEPETLNNALAIYDLDPEISKQLKQDSIDKIRNTPIPNWLLVH
jgi:hypothetical protein